MPTELEELVEFAHHGNTEIRQIAVANLVGYSTVQPSIFKINQLTPVKDLKLLVKDYPVIAKNALTILINISEDKEVMEYMAGDDAFIETLMARITNPQEPNANEIAMLFANLAKSEKMKRILTLQRDIPKQLSTSKNAMDQLMDCFVKGAEGTYNKKADFDYLSYLFADVAKFEEGRKHFMTPRKHDNDIVPLTKLTVFTEHKSTIRRRGVASTVKNVCFDVDSHKQLLSSTGVNVLPYTLLPIMGPEDYSDEDMEGMLEDLQLLPPDKKREADMEILKMHLETLLLLTSTKEGRDSMRAAKVYPIIRETHAHVDHEEVREACDRVVQMIMRDEEGERGDAQTEQSIEVGESGVKQIADADVDEDDRLIEVV